MLINIVRTTNGLPDTGAGVLASLSLPSSGIPVTPNNFTEMLTGVDIGGIAPPVSQGEVLALVLSTTDLFYWNARLDSYPRGEGFRREVPNSFRVTGSDFGFRTFVETAAPVSEPTTLVLLGTGLLGLLGACRHCRGRSGATERAERQRAQREHS